MATIEKRSGDDGKHSFRVKIRLKGHPSETATFSRITDAKKWAQLTEAAILEGRHFKTTEAKKRTLADLVDRYKKDVLPRKTRSTHQVSTQGMQLDWWKSELGSYTLADVTPALIAERRDKLLNSKTVRGTIRSPSTVVRYMAALSHAFSIAVKEWGWLEDSPMRKVQKPKEPRGRVRFLNDKERKALLTACKASRSPLLYPIVVIALSTGMRLGEILSLTWDDVDTNTGRLILHYTKNGERRVVPLTSHALEVIKELKEEAKKVPRIDTNLVFPRTNDQLPANIRTAWDNAMGTAGIKDFRFHDLRHTAASYLAMNGATLAEIAEVLGHKTLMMVKRYAHLSEAHTSKVVERMNQQIFGG